MHHRHSTYDIDTGGRRWMTRQEAADYARVTARTIDRARRLGELRAGRVGATGRARYLRADIDAWLGAGRLAVVGGRS